jgi:hypothetical protein
MKTLRELAELVNEREGDLAYGSETGLLGAFVDKYATTDACIHERGEEPVSDEEYQAWADAYAKMERLEAAGEDYDINDLF